MADKRIRTFEEWVADLDEAKKGILPDFIADKVKKKDGGKGDWKETDDTEEKSGKNKKWHNDGVKGKRPPVDKGKKEKDKGQKTGEGKREKE